jgi:hypothetical protein
MASVFVTVGSPAIALPSSRIAPSGVREMVATTGASGSATHAWTMTLCVRLL